MSLTQIFLAIMLIFFLIGLYVFVRQFIFQYKKHKWEQEMYLRVKRRRENESQKDLIDKLSKK